jgi:hypothetical protein
MHKGRWKYERPGSEYKGFILARMNSNGRRRQYVSRVVKCELLAGLAEYRYRADALTAEPGSVSIYAMTDCCDRVVYVGATKRTLERRLVDHLQEKRDLAKRTWLQLNPDARVHLLMRVTEEDAPTIEADWIIWGASRGLLLNVGTMAGQWVRIGTWRNRAEYQRPRD